MTRALSHAFVLAPLTPWMARSAHRYPVGITIEKDFSPLLTCPPGEGWETRGTARWGLNGFPFPKLNIFIWVLIVGTLQGGVEVRTTFQTQLPVFPH